MVPHQIIDENGVVMNVLNHMKSIFGDAPKLLGMRHNTAAYLWRDDQNSDSGIMCTVGMSGRAQTLSAEAACPSSEPRTELLAYCRLSDTEVLAELLLDLAEYPFQHGKHLFWWQVMPLGRTLVPDSDIAGVLLSMPPISTHQMTFTVDGHRVDIIWIVPILRNELTYAQQHGIQALEVLLETADVDVTNIGRR